MNVNAKFILNIRKELVCKLNQLFLQYFGNNIIPRNHVLELSSAIFNNSLYANHVVEKVLIKQNNIIAELLRNVLYLIELLNVLVDEDKYLICCYFYVDSLS